MNGPSSAGTRVLAPPKNNRTHFLLAACLLLHICNVQIQTLALEYAMRPRGGAKPEESQRQNAGAVFPSSRALPVPDFCSLLSRH